MRTRWHVWAVGLALLGALPCHAGSVTLTDGSTLRGTVTLLADGPADISVKTPGQPPKLCKFSEIRSALFDSLAGPNAPAAEDFVPWARAEVSALKRPRLADIQGQAITIKDGSDAFHLGPAERAAQANPGEDRCFIFQKLEWDGEIVAQVLPASNPATSPGLMICEGLSDDGPMVLLSCDPHTNTSASLTLRTAQGEDAYPASPPHPADAPARWLKLHRTWDTFKAYESPDGLAWNFVAEARVEMDDKKGVYLGVTAAAANADLLAAFDHVRLTGRRSAAIAPGTADPRLPDVLVRLKDGSAIVGLLQSAAPKGQAQIKKFGGDAMTVPTAALARAQFAPLSREDLEKTAADAPGALTRDGDFLTGEIKELVADKATVSSVTFGLTTFECRRLALLIFQPTGAPEPRLIEIRLQDGSLLLVRSLAIQKDQLLLDEPLLGRLQFPLHDILSLDRKP